MSRNVALCLLLLSGSCATAAGTKGGLAPVDNVSADQVHRALRPRKIALCIGINRFADGRWPELRYAEKDAAQLADHLGRYGGFDKVYVLVSREATTLRNIRKALSRIEKLNRDPADTVVVYFSTHGTLSRGRRGDLARYLVASDTNMDRIPRTALMVEELYGFFDRLPSRRKALILATCHSGSGKSGLPPTIARELRGTKGTPVFPPLHEVSQAAMVLTACAFGETAREDDTLGHDVYTAFLLEAIENGKGDTDGDGAVTASEAHAIAMQKTYEFSKGRQRPQVESMVLGMDPIVLSGRRTKQAKPSLFSWAQRLAGIEVEVDGRPKGKLPGRVVLEPGRHVVVLKEPGSADPYIERTVELEPDQQIEIDSLLLPEEHRWEIRLAGGYQVFLDGSTRRQLVAPTPMGGFSAGVKKLLFGLLELRFDLAAGGGWQRLAIGGRSVDQRLVELSYGLSVLYPFTMGPISMSVGPRVAGVHLFRSVMEGVGDQQFFNMSPGIMADVRLAIWKNLFLGLEARLHFFAVKTKTESLNLGYLDVFAGTGWLF